MLRCCRLRDGDSALFRYRHYYAIISCCRFCRFFADDVIDYRRLIIIDIFRRERWRCCHGRR